MCAFSDCGKEECFGLPEKAQGPWKGSQCRLNAEILISLASSVLPQNSLLSDTFCLYRGDRASGCEIVRPHLETGERKRENKSLCHIPPPLPLYRSYSTLILTFSLSSFRDQI